MVKDYDLLEDIYMGVTMAQDYDLLDDICDD